MFSFDVNRVITTLALQNRTKIFLGFSWGGNYYVFTVLPFGLSTACYIHVFTKMLRSLVQYWREQGIRIVVYLDVGLGAASGSAGALAASELLCDALNQAGFVINRENQPENLPGLGAASGSAGALAASELLCDTLNRAGFVINRENQSENLPNDCSGWVLSMILLTAR